MPIHSRRDGFAMPMVILVMGFMTAGALAAFARSGAEVQISDNQVAQTRAFALADAGLARYMAAGKVSPDTATYTDMPGGTVGVRAVLIRPSVGSGATATQALYLIRSTGTMTSPAGRPMGRRTVAQLAFRQRGTMQVLSSWTSLSGLRKNGASGNITGADECTDAELAGVAVPTGTLTGKDEAISGNPDVNEMGTQAQMASQIKIDWVGITNASSPSIASDHTLCISGSYGYDANWSPCNGWPTTAQRADTSYWPTIVINGSSALPSDGRGTLIVTGDLTFGGGDQWDGIIMVGGKITDNGSGDISGAVVSGLNVLRGWTVDESSKANGTKDYTYNSCEVQRAADGQSRLAQLSNAWIDNWSAW